MKLTEDEAWRFWSKVEPVDSGCWEWRGALAEGYGVLTMRGRGHRAHRVVYELTTADIPRGLVIDHTCRNPCCVNPAHLDPVTNGENVLRGISFSARNKRKTHCPSGHAYDSQNTIAFKGRRICRECNAARCRDWYNRNERKTA